MYIISPEVRSRTPKTRPDSRNHALNLDQPRPQASIPTAIAIAQLALKHPREQQLPAARNSLFQLAGHGMRAGPPHEEAQEEQRRARVIEQAGEGTTSSVPCQERVLVLQLCTSPVPSFLFHQADMYSLVARSLLLIH